MKQYLSILFINNWQRKLLALVFAVIIWVLVDHSIMLTKTFTNVSIRVVNLPPNKTIEGYLSDGVLTRRVTLTLTGSKAVLEMLQSSDLEVVLDASGRSNEWVVSLSKKDIRCLNPEIDLLQNLTEVSHQELFISLENLITEKVPIFIKNPTGEPPQGYQFLDIWPRELTYTVSGPEAQVKKLKAKGIELTFNLNDITKAELDALEAVHQQSDDDEITFYIPEKWKKIPIPFLNNQFVQIDDPEAKFLHIDFLRNALLRIEQEIPIRAFFPLEYSLTINPDTYSLALNEFVGKKNGILVLTKPLFAKDVSRLFLDVVQNNIELVIVAHPKSESTTLAWTIQFINSKFLENQYVDMLIAAEVKSQKNVSSSIRSDTNYLRERFRNYMRKFMLYTSKGTEISFDAKLHGSAILVQESVQKSEQDKNND